MCEDAPRHFVGQAGSKYHDCPDLPEQPQSCASDSNGRQGGLFLTALPLPMAV